jgi:hypothetical protein
MTFFAAADPVWIASVTMLLLCIGGALVAITNLEA